MKPTPTAPPPEWSLAAQDALIGQHPDHADDVRRGVAAAAGVFPNSPESFETFCIEHYVAPGPERSRLLRKLDDYLGALYGHLGVVRKETRMGLDVDDGPFTAMDRLFAAFSADAHVAEDLRHSGIAAAIQLNFGGVPDDPSAIEERSDEAWAALALSRVGVELVPADLRQQLVKGQTKAESLVQSYNFYLGNIRFPDPQAEFDQGVRLISHWGLRDFMTNLNGAPDALPRQRAILGLMERVVRGQVPEIILDNPTAGWDIPAGTVQTNGHPEPAKGEGARRWQPFRELFAIQREIDPHTRRGNLIDTAFLERRRIPEARVEGMLTALLISPEIGRIARFVERRLGRPIEPFDIYYHGFQDETRAAAHLDELVAGRYPTREALQADLPNLLQHLSFPALEANRIAGHIRIDNARSAGHAWPPATETDLQLLRMRVPATGVDWQEFGTFMHELGHAVEGVLSSYGMPYQLLWSVPNVAFSEAFAFTFQDLALEVLGEAAERDRDVEILQRVWEAFEIAGPALAEMRLFRWLYAHPEASAESIHAQIQAIGDEMWAAYHAPIFGARSYGQMSVYSHMLWGGFYLAEYPLGYIMAYQIRRHLASAAQAGKSLAEEMTRMCRLGAIYPDAWMMQAVGERVGVEPMLADCAAALERLGL